MTSGLRVVLVPCEAESVAVGVFVASGSRHEDAKTAGISHFIEHMLFKGTPTRTPLDITRAIEGRGGNFNACTGEESTCYFAHLPSEHLGEAVDILADMYLHASIPADEFAREKQVVIEEIRMYADEPDAVAAENMQRSLFPKSTLGWPVAGSAASLNPLKPFDLKRYIRSHYRADNTVLVIVGSFDESDALRLVSKSFRFRRQMGTDPKSEMGTDPKSEMGTDPKSEMGTDPRAAACIPSVTVRKDIQQAQLALGYRTFGLADRRTYAATVMDAVLGRGMSSRLFQEVREKRGLSYDISSRMQFFSDAGMFSVTAGLDAAKGTLALKTIDRELVRIANKRVSTGELARMKEFLVGNFRLSHEKVTSKMFFYGQTLLAFGRLVEPGEQVEKIAAVTSDDVLAAAKAIFRPGNRTVSWVLPNRTIT